MKIIPLSEFRQDGQCQFQYLIRTFSISKSIIWILTFKVPGRRIKQKDYTEEIEGRQGFQVGIVDQVYKVNTSEIRLT